MADWTDAQLLTRADAELTRQVKLARQIPPDVQHLVADAHSRVAAKHPLTPLQRVNLAAVLNGLPLLGQVVGIHPERQEQTRADHG